jgi:hypothetical protein
MSTALPLPACRSNDDTDRRILAFLASMQPLRGGSGEVEEFHRGRSIIERMAISAEGDGEPTIRLTAEHCADVLKYLAGVEPLEPLTWWQDPPDSPSHLVGFQFVLHVLEANLREATEGAQP